VLERAEPLVVLFSFMVLRKSRFSVASEFLSGTDGPPPKLCGDGWFGESEDMALRSYSDGTDGFLRWGDG